MTQAARITDPVTHGSTETGDLANGSPDVTIGGKRAARAGRDFAPECNGNFGVDHRPKRSVKIAEGSKTVSINGRPAARVGDKLTCGAKVKMGCSNVTIGGPPAAEANPAPFLLDAKLARLAKRKALIAQGKAAAAGMSGKAQQAMLAATSRLESNNKVVERARLADDVYHDSGAPVGWTRLSDQQSKSGFYSAVYQSQIDGSVVLAYRGTNPKSAQDWETNAEQGTGQETAQYRESEVAAKSAKAAYGNNLEITGHSKGGGEAADASAVTGLHADTFNAAGLHPNTVERQGTTLEAAGSHVENYSVDGEVLTTAQGPAGNIAVQIGSIILTPTHTPTPSLRVYPAVGRQHKLPAVDANGDPATKAGPVDRHGMEYVINGLEKQKSDDTQTIQMLLGQ